MTESEHVEDRRLLVDAVRGAGNVVMRFFEREVEVWHKSRSQPVSEADMAVNRYLHDRLTRARPDYGWLSEEGPDDPRRLERDRVWVVDPVDGTRAFLRGTSDFAVSVALVEDGRPVLGTVLRPVFGDLFVAERGAGATLDGEPLRIAERSRLDGCRMLADEAFFKAAKHWPVAWPEMEYHSIASIALRLCLVGARAFDAMVTVRPKADWDLAAADLVVSEAGGRVVDETGTELRYNRPQPEQACTVVAPPGLIPAILERVRPAMERYCSRRLDNAQK